MSGYGQVSTPPIANTTVSLTTTVTTTSTTAVAMTGTSITVAQVGTYLVIFSTAIQQNIAGDTVSVGIATGGTLDANSVRTVAPFDGGALSAGQASCGLMTHGVYTLAAGTVIQIQWAVNAGTGSVAQRTLTATKII